MSDAKKRILTIQITNNVVWNKDISNAKRHFSMLISTEDYNHILNGGVCFEYIDCLISI